MAKKKVVKDETKVDTRELFAALAALAEERGLPSDYLIEKIKTAIIGAIKKDYLVGDENVVVDIIPEMDVFAASLLRDVVEDFDVENEHTQIGLSEARRLRPG